LAKKIVLVLAILSAVSVVAPAAGRGVSPYLPLNLSPDIERQIERVLVLAGKPVMRRPIPAAVVLDALPAACAVDAVLCERVRRYLRLYQRNAGITLLQGQLSASSGDGARVLANAHGRDAGSSWQLAGSAFYQPWDHLLLSAGGVAYDGRATPTGTVLSMGFDFAQLDVGFRDHWLSPLTDSSLLISTEAATMPSVTLSNYEPISFLGINYEVFVAQMSKQTDIAYFDSTTTGYPRLAGVQIGVEPVTGYSLALNRVMQYGGGERGGSALADLKEALIANSNRPDAAGESEEFGNQIASITGSLVFPGVLPFVARIEYAGEDNAYKGNRRLGDTALSLGLDFPRIGDRYDLSYEISEWQNVWYTHHLYPVGLTNHGRVIGHWFGDQRVFGDRKGGQSQSLQVGRRDGSGNYWRATYRTLGFQQSYGYEITPPVPYQRMHELGLQYTTAWHGFTVGAELSGGRDVFGGSFARLAATLDLAGDGGHVATTSAPTGDGSNATAELFVDAGANNSLVYKLLTMNHPENGYTARSTGYHFGLGARRPVASFGDIGMRLELDDIDGHSMFSLRAVDYRHRFGKSIAASGFFGVGRYDYGAPMYGYYWGAGLQWMNALPHWDVGLDWRYHDKLSRNRILPDDPPNSYELPRIHIDAEGYALYISRKFTL
jgi:hypothetical protein